MFWQMTGLSAASPVESILEKEQFTLDDLLDEDEVIQECKALNARLINFLGEKPQVEQLIRYIVEEDADGADKRRSFKFPFVSCEIFTCEVENILNTLVNDEELMNLLFSFLNFHRPHSSLLAGYFSKVVICLLLRKTVPLMAYVKEHPDILKRLVDLIGITSVMEVLIRLLGTDEHIYSDHIDAIQWIEESNVLEMILEKFNSSDSPEVHANVAETLCAITRFAPPGLAAKIASPTFIERLFSHALDQRRPKSVLVNSLSICISLLDPKRLNVGAYHAYSRQLSHGTIVTASSQTVEGMLDSIGGLLNLLDVSSSEDYLATTYGKLQPPLGNHRLKIIEFISVLLTIGSEAAEKELVKCGAVQSILDLFFLYPFNNFLHHQVENIISTTLENKNALLIQHLLCDCHLIDKILEAEKNSILSDEPSKPTISAEGRRPPRIGLFGHLTRISNKLIQSSSCDTFILTVLQSNAEWANWQANDLSRRNVVENVYQWACGRPMDVHDRRDSDDDEYFHERDYGAASLANNLSHAFRYGIYGSDEMDEVHGSAERDDEDGYFDDESAEVVISSLRLGDDSQSKSLFTNSNWFVFEDDFIANDRSADLPSPSHDNNGTRFVDSNDIRLAADDDLDDTATSSVPEPIMRDETMAPSSSPTDKPPAWVEWRETPNSDESSARHVIALPNGDAQMDVASSISPASPFSGHPPPPPPGNGDPVSDKVIEFVKDEEMLEEMPETK